MCWGWGGGHKITLEGTLEALWPGLHSCLPFLLEWSRVSSGGQGLSSPWREQLLTFGADSSFLELVAASSMRKLGRDLEEVPLCIIYM